MAVLVEHGDGSEEWVRVANLRPTPPPPPSGSAWVSKLGKGELIDLRYDGAWWEVVLVGRSGARLQVLAVRYAKAHDVHAAELRPWWQRNEAGMRPHRPKPTGTTPSDHATTRLPFQRLTPRRWRLTPRRWRVAPRRVARRTLLLS